MKFYVKKAIKFRGVKFSFTKSNEEKVEKKGIFRKKIKAKGNFAYINQDGIYYKTSIEGKKGVPLKFEELVEEINQKRKLMTLKWFSIFGLFEPTIFIILFFVLAVIDYYRKTVVILYNIDTVMQEKLQEFYNSFKEIIGCSKKWYIVSTSQNTNYKYNSGATELVKRKGLYVNYRKIPKVKTNIKVACIQLGKCKLYFLPDKILKFKGKKVTALDYKDLGVQISASRYIENGVIPFDGTIVDYTWTFVNANGGPDRRFTNNPRIPIMQYTQIQFNDSSELDETIQLSKANVGYKLKEKITNMQFEMGNNKETKKHNVVEETVDIVAKNDMEEIRRTINRTISYAKNLEQQLELDNEEKIKENEKKEIKEEIKEDVKEEEKDDDIRKNNMFYKG